MMVMMVVIGMRIIVMIIDGDGDDGDRKQNKRQMKLYS